MQIRSFPLSDFERLVPLLLRCFPEFWEARFLQGLRSFPYDVELFTAVDGGKITGNIGLHPYGFSLAGERIDCGGVSDVAVDPEFRGRGLARELLAFIRSYSREKYPAGGFLPLYTDKPKVYHSSSWREYFSDREGEMTKKDFPRKNAFSFSPALLDPAFLNGERAAVTEEEKRAEKILAIYRNGKDFPGKVFRSPKTWQELFAERSYSWQVEKDSYFLYKGEELLEGYSLDDSHSVNAFTPCHGGHDGNFLMVSEDPAPGEKYPLLQKALREKKLVFPIADTF